MTASFIDVPLTELCSVIRSKQAGPFRLTFDLVFKTWEPYERAKRAGAINKDIVASLYRIPKEQITDLVFYDPGRAVKITIVRPKVAGDPGDGDVYGCQQHAPFLGLIVRLPPAEDNRRVG